MTPSSHGSILPLSSPKNSCEVNHQRLSSAKASSISKPCRRRDFRFLQSTTRPTALRPTTTANQPIPLARSSASDSDETIASAKKSVSANPHPTGGMTATRVPAKKQLGMVGPLSTPGGNGRGLGFSHLGRRKILPMRFNPSRASLGLIGSPVT